MSWKATAFVKDLNVCLDGRKITRSEKLLLFVLADYHNTESRNAWPSLKVLARDALMSLRQAQRCLLSLEKSQILMIDKPTGRGKVHLYSFADLDDRKGVTMSPFISGKGDIPAPERVTFQSGKGDISGPIKKNQIHNQEIKPKATARAPFSLPDWIPKDAWDRFDEMRTAKDRKAWTQGAKQLTVRKLAELQRAGDEPGAVLDQSVQRGWRGVFAIEGGSGGGYKNKAEQVAEHNARVFKAALARHQQVAGDLLAELPQPSDRRDAS